MLNIGIVGVTDSIPVLIFMRLPAASRRRLLAGARSLDEVSLGEIARAIRS